MNAITLPHASWDNYNLGILLTAKFPGCIIYSLSDNSPLQYESRRSHGELGVVPAL